MTYPLGSGLLGSPSEGYEGPFLTNTEPGTELMYSVYDFHTLVYFRNGVLREIVGSSNASSYYGWCDFTVYPGGWVLTHAPGYHWNPDADGHASFQTRRFNGATVSNLNSYTAGPQDTANWTEYLGLSVAWAGHEDHRGGTPVTIPANDLEERSYYRLRRSSTLPKTIYSARLYGQRTGSYPNYVYNYTIAVDPSGMYYVSYDSVAATVQYQLQQGVAPSAAAADPDSFTTIATVDVTDNGTGLGDSGYLTNVYLNPADGLDIGHKLGYPGCMADGSWTQWWCNLDMGQWNPAHSAYNPSPRWPSDPIPRIDFLFCPYHLGILSLDGEKYGYIPVYNTVAVQIGGAQLLVPTPPGWGWDKENMYEWKDWYGNHAGPYPETMAYSIEGVGGILHLDGVEPGSADHDQYGWREIEVRADVNDAAQAYRPSRLWAFEWVGYFTGSVLGVGEWGEGPELSFGMGPAEIKFHPGLNEVWYYEGGNWTILTNINLYSMFHVRVVKSTTGWAGKVWQHGNPVPSAWGDWLGSTSTSTYALPQFYLWQDSDLPYGTHTPVEVTFTCAGYTFWDLTGTTDPLVVGSWSVQPTGGSVDESRAPLAAAADGSASLPTRVMGGGNNSTGG